MGKRSKRLRMKKYAKKYASVRATVARLGGVVEEALADGVITPEEVVQIEEARQEVLDAIKEEAPLVVKEVVQAVDEVIKDVQPEENLQPPVDLEPEIKKTKAPVKKEASAEKKKPSKKKPARRSARKTKTEG